MERRVIVTVSVENDRDLVHAVNAIIRGVEVFPNVIKNTGLVEAKDITGHSAVFSFSVEENNGTS